MNYKNKHLIEQYKILHNDPKKPLYGNGYNSNIIDLNHLNKFLQTHSSKTILDYGCGKGDLIKYLNESYNCYGYDPAVDEYNNEHKDKNFDTIVCLDVLEHIPENELKYLFDHIKSYNAKTLYFNVSTRYAKTLLPDGRNCHETVKPQKWWDDLFNESFSSKKVIVEDQSYRDKRNKLIGQIRVLIYEN
jgi:cyclopropane fatty-acyl-phospholipid synthase-like methyltransferase